MKLKNIIQEFGFPDKQNNWLDSYNINVDKNKLTKILRLNDIKEYHTYFLISNPSVEKFYQEIRITKIEKLDDRILLYHFDLDSPSSERMIELTKDDLTDNKYISLYELKE